MYGAILGDIIGSPYEFDRGEKTKDFPLFCEESEFTDDTVMMVAVAEALIKAREAGWLDHDALDDGRVEQAVKESLVRSMQNWGHEYPNAGYGARFTQWLWADDPKPYGSFGNGSAMRVAAAGWLMDSLEDTRRVARWTAEVTHDHSEGVKGAEATAAAIYMARTGSAKNSIRDYITRVFGYDLTRTIDEIRPGYHHVESCQETVPEAITAFLEGESFEDVIKTAVSLGGDCDTLTCIAGSIAEAFYGVDPWLKDECLARIPEEMIEVIEGLEKLKG